MKKYATIAGLLCLLALAGCAGTGTSPGTTQDEHPYSTPYPEPRMNW